MDIDEQNEIQRMNQELNEEEKQNDNKFEERNEKNQGQVHKYFTTLNYREFLSKTVKFNKVVELRPHQARPKELQREASDKSQNFNGYINSDHKSNTPYYSNQTSNANSNYNNEIQSNFDIEERIHINYRLQYLKDTVMARYIDDTALKVINQLIQQNNREIVSVIFGLNQNTQGENSYGNVGVYGSMMNGSMKSNQQQNYGLSQWGGYIQNGKTIKDQIVEKIKSKTNIQERFQAIEFMIELCQILKGFQFQSGFLGGPNAGFQYNSGPIGFNSRQITDQLNHVNLIGLLAESLNIFVPSSETLEAHLNYFKNLQYPYQVQLNEYKKTLIELYQKQNQSMEKYVVEDLLEFTKERNEQIHQNFQKELYQHAITRVDKMKINSMEIIISFYQNTHIPMNDINKFVLGDEQKQRNLPFLNNLVSHLIYSPEQGIKIQICDFFKSLLDCEQSSLNNISSKEQLYKNVLKKFIEFLKKFKIDEVDNNNINQNNENNQIEERQKYEKFKQLEYSTYLIMQILNKVVSEHRYPFKTFMIQNEVIQTVGDLAQIQSKLVNVEIIKFYKCLLKSKDPSYIQMITQKHLFNAVIDIFEINFQEARPPMILSCIRDLFENIFRMSMGKSQMNQNELYNQKLVDYLIRINQKSKSVIFNPKYKSIFKKYDLKDMFQNDDGENFIIDENERKNNNNNASSPQPDRDESELNVISPVSPASPCISDSDLGSQNGNENDECIGLQYSNPNNSITYSSNYQYLQQQQDKQQDNQKNTENFKKDGFSQSEKGRYDQNSQRKNQSNEYRIKYNINILFGEEFNEDERIEREKNVSKNIDVLNQYMQYPLSDDDEDQIKGGLSPIGQLKQSIPLDKTQEEFSQDSNLRQTNAFFDQLSQNKFSQQSFQKQKQHDNSEFLLDLQDEPEDEVNNKERQLQTNINEQIEQNNQSSLINQNQVYQNSIDQNDSKNNNEEEIFQNIERIELEKESIIIDNKKIKPININEIKRRNSQDDKNSQQILEKEETQIIQQKFEKIQNSIYHKTVQQNKYNHQSLSENLQSQYSDASQFSQNSPPSFQLNQSNKNSAQKDAQPFEKVSCSSSDHLYNLIDDKELVQDLGIFNIDLSQTNINRKTSDLNGTSTTHNKLIYRTNKSPGTIQNQGACKSDNGKFKSQALKTLKDEGIKKYGKQKSIDDSEIVLQNEMSESNDIINESISNQQSEKQIEDCEPVLQGEIDENNDNCQQIKIGIKRNLINSTVQIQDHQLLSIQQDELDDSVSQSQKKRQKTLDEVV